MWDGTVNYEEFLAWLKSLDSNQMVGIATDSFHCPIANFAKTTKGKFDSLEITEDEIIAVFSALPDDETDHKIIWDTDDLAHYFIQNLDDRCEQYEPVSAGVAIEVLEDTAADLVGITR